VSQLLKNTRLVVSALAIIALVLGGLIYRDIFVPAKNTSGSLNLYTVTRRTVTASVTGTGNLVPQTQANVSFKMAGTLTAIYVTVGDHVTTGQSLAAIDSTSEQNALTAAQANLATAEANLQAAQTPLTQNQITQLQDAVTTAQQSYNDTVAQVNLTNSQDSAQVAADQSQLATDQQSLTFNGTYQADLQKLATDKAALQTAITTFDNDGCKMYSYPFTSPPAPAPCAADFATVGTDQATVTADQATINAFLGVTQVNADQAKLTADLAKQQADKVNGQHSINQAAASLTNAQDQLKTQTESRPNQVLSAQAGVAQAQAALQTAQQNLSNTTLAAPMDGVVNSINGVVGEDVSPGAGSTPESPGSQAPLPTSTAASAFMVIGNISSMEAVIPFAESDASKLAFNQAAQVTFDAVPNLTISGHVVAVASSATVTSGVVDYYATVTLNQTNETLKQGMTANATVTVSKATNALVVPNNAITRVAGQAYVNLYVSGQQVQTAIETGVVGDQFTEVTGGLNEGAQIVLPTVRVSSGTGTTRGNFGGGGGGAVRIGG
jgi:HlyD family secretion protein